ncbi:hypothetical protein BVC80_1289g82 [Macleaya cordata]|uniref:Uncharacterized protein n=1 Tax=Macleaya cordata TaxID=56857 RepID=A0A200Q9N9_MACCD|nr:hypothetical protein BVC80_1289g82 [Macleaya cordata]
MEIRSEPEDLKVLGIFGIFGEASNIINSWKQIFNKITIFLILPLSFIFLANIHVSRIVFSGILQDEIASIMQGHSLDRSINDSSFWSKFIGFWMFVAANNFLVMIISLLSTSAIVYTVSCIYINAAANLTLSYHAVYIAMSFPILLVLSSHNAISPTVVIIFTIVYLMGFTCINVIWHLACVVSVVEEDQNLCGIKAMKKSKALVKGKFLVSSFIFVMVHSCLVMIQVASMRIVEKTTWMIWVKVIYEILCLLSISLVIQVGLVMECVIYFVCKSYHDEFDKTSLANHLKVYLEDYVDLKGKGMGIP